MTEVNKEAQGFSPFEHDLHRSIISVGALFGLRGFRVDIKPDNEWSTSHTKDGISIHVNPEGLGKNEAGEHIELTFDEVLYVTAHEIGHVLDMVDEGYIKSKKPSDHFFWNVIDDTVIDSRLHAAPTLERARQTIYPKRFPKLDLTDAPLHIQFAHAILLTKNIPESSYRLAPEVETAIQSIRDYTLQSGHTLNIIDILAFMRTTQRERRHLGHSYIKPIYDRFLKEDQQSSDESDQSKEEFSQLYEAYETAMHGEGHKDDESNDTSSDADSGESSDNKADAQSESTSTSGTAHAIAEEVRVAIEAKNAEPEDKNQEPTVRSARTPDKEPGLSEQSKKKAAGYIREEMNLSIDMSNKYLDTLLKYRGEISAVADLFLMLASRSDVTTAPRFDHRADTDGKRLHPLRLSKAALQTITRSNEAIWQPITRRGKRQEIAFGGLDIHFLVDVSTSMKGESAKAAAASALILLEGLDLAKERASRESAIFTTPDVRTQIIAFGSSSEVLAPLTLQATPVQKGITFSNLRNPSAGSTYVSSSLRNVADSATHHQQRDQLAIIVTDGAFSDLEVATMTAQEMTDNVRVIQINVDGSHESIGHDSVKLSDARDLPIELRAAIQNYVESVL